MTQVDTTSKSKVFTALHSWWRNIILLVLVNVVCLIGIFFLAREVNNQAKSLQKNREEKIKLDFQNQNIVVADELERYKDDASKLDALFLDDARVFEFISKMDELKSQGIISEFTIASDNIEKDLLGFPGLPITLDILGSQDKINNSLQIIYDLDVLLNPIYLEITKVEGNTFTYKLGGFLYVSETFN